jgi:hypothetical protein
VVDGGPDPGGELPCFPVVPLFGADGSDPVEPPDGVGVVVPLLIVVATGVQVAGAVVLLPAALEVLLLPVLILLLVLLLPPLAVDPAVVVLWQTGRVEFVPAESPAA